MHLLPAEQWTATSRAQKPRRLQVLASSVFDSKSATFLSDQVVTVSRVTGLISAVAPIQKNKVYTSSATVDVIDLRGDKVVLLPGLIDTHVHSTSFTSEPSMREHAHIPDSGSVSVLASLLRDVLDGPGDQGEYRGTSNSCDDPRLQHVDGRVHCRQVGRL